ncbi:hypothetical protein ABTN11_20800, partial [Acinetobacter baumannii]
KSAGVFFEMHGNYQTTAPFKKPRPRATQTYQPTAINKKRTVNNYLLQADQAPLTLITTATTAHPR